MKPQCGCLSSKVAAALPVMMSILAGSFRGHRVEALVLETSDGIFHWLLIAKLHAFLCFWHCVLPSFVWVCCFFRMRTEPTQLTIGWPVLAIPFFRLFVVSMAHFATSFIINYAMASGTGQRPID